MGENYLELLDKWVLAREGRRLRRAREFGGVSLTAIDHDRFQFVESISLSKLDGVLYMCDGRHVFMHFAAEIVNALKSAGRWDV